MDSILFDIFLLVVKNQDLSEHIAQYRGIFDTGKSIGIRITAIFPTVPGGRYLQPIQNE